MLIQAFLEDRANYLFKNPLIEIWYLFSWSLAKKSKSISCLLAELVHYERHKERRKMVLLYIHVG